MFCVHMTPYAHEDVSVSPKNRAEQKIAVQFSSLVRIDGEGRIMLEPLNLNKSITSCHINKSR